MQLIKGATYVLRGAKILLEPGIRMYAILPLLINTVLFAVGTYEGIAWGGEWIDWAVGQLPGWLLWLKWILWPILVMLLLVVVFFGFSLLANIISSPCNGPLADAVERHLGGAREEADFRLSALVKDAGKAMMGAVKKLLYMAAWSIPLLLFSLVPGMQPVASVLWFLFGAWMLAFEYIDYPMGNHGYTFPEQRKLLRSHWGAALGFGAGALGISLVPVLNFIAVPAGVAGATIFWVETLRSDATPAIVNA